MKYHNLLIAITLFSQFGSAQNQLTPEILWRVGRLGDEQVSPDGKSVLYGITTYDVKENKGSRDLYVVDLKSLKVNRLTNTPKSEGQARWRPDGKVIGFLYNEGDGMQLWEINPDGTGRRQVTRVQGDITGFIYAPAGDKLLYTADVKMDKDLKDLYPDLPLAEGRIIDDMMYRHWDSWHDYAYSHIFYVSYKDGTVGDRPTDILDGEKADAPIGPFGDVSDIAWSNDGNTIFYSSKKKSGIEFATGTNSEIYAFDLGTNKTKNLSEGLAGYDTHPSVSPGGKLLVWKSMARDGFEADKDVLVSYHLETLAFMKLTDHFPESIGSFTWSDDGKRIFFTSGEMATVQIFEMEIETKKISRITSGDYNYNSVSFAGDQLVATRTSMTEPQDIYTIDLKTKKVSRLTKANPWYADVKPVKVEKRMVKTTDNKEMLVWVIYPPDFDKSKKYPALLYCQGGPQSTVNQFYSYRWNFHLMASNGYIVVAPNRRGLPSFGQEWNDAISGDWGGQAIQDYLSAIDDVSKESFVDKEKIGAVGASYGGYSVYQLAGMHNKRFKAFVSHCGIFNLESWYGTTEEMFFANWDMQGPYWNDPQPKSYQRFSPHKFVKNWDTPMLVIHGEKDFRVPVGQGMEAFQAAQLRGIPSRFLYLPEEGHWVLRPQNSLLWNNVFFEWLNKWLK